MRDDLDAAASRLLRLIGAEIDLQVGDMPLPRSVQIGTTITIRPPGAPAAPRGYRFAANREAITIRITSGPFNETASVAHLAVFVARTADVAPLRLVTTAASSPTDLALRDVIPEVRQVARIRLAAWVGGVLDLLVAKAAEQA
jgi:hypothetical protein